MHSVGDTDADAEIDGDGESDLDDLGDVVVDKDAELVDVERIEPNGDGDVVVEAVVVALTDTDPVADAETRPVADTETDFEGATEAL